jgi:hypothetical protein
MLVLERLLTLTHSIFYVLFFVPHRQSLRVELSWIERIVDGTHRGWNASWIERIVDRTHRGQYFSCGLAWLIFGGQEVVGGI